MEYCTVAWGSAMDCHLDLFDCNTARAYKLYCGYDVCNLDHSHIGSPLRMLYRFGLMSTLICMTTCLLLLFPLVTRDRQWLFTIFLEQLSAAELSSFGAISSVTLF